MPSKKKTTFEELPIATSYEKIADVSRYFGFIPIETPVYDTRVLNKMKSLKDDTHGASHKKKTEEVLYKSHLVEKATYIQKYLDGWKKSGQILSLYTELPFKKSGTKKAPKTAHFSLDIIGSEQSIADAILMQTVQSTLEEEGFKGISFEINCIGEKDATLRFERELTGYFRKHISKLTPDQQKLFKQSVFQLIQNAKSTEEFDELMKEAPQAMNFLSENGRHHFKEVLEHLENLNINYEINGFLIENKNYSTHTIFAARDKKGTLLALGGRYNNLARKIGTRKDIPAVGATLCYKYTKVRKEVKRNKFPKPQFYFMQLGIEAKVKSLMVVEQLRKKKISVAHTFMRDKASSQLGNADNLKLPYVLIMGKKEAHENTIAVRENATRSQKVIPMSDLSTHLKTLQKKLAKKK